MSPQDKIAEVLKIPHIRASYIFKYGCFALAHEISDDFRFEGDFECSFAWTKKNKSWLAPYPRSITTPNKADCFEFAIEDINAARKVLGVRVHPDAKYYNLSPSNEYENKAYSIQFCHEDRNNNYISVYWGKFRSHCSGYEHPEIMDPFNFDFDAHICSELNRFYIEMLETVRKFSRQLYSK